MGKPFWSKLVRSNRHKGRKFFQLWGSRLNSFYQKTWFFDWKEHLLDLLLGGTTCFLGEEINYFANEILVSGSRWLIKINVGNAFGKLVLNCMHCP